ncbi:MULTISPECIES: GNAT family N-acetyltransferase [unclassified Rhizobium]|uniref:GNAT family N-acetyltransferase n=1 Tax=unclassified Rhizobium TaxID=2613769 RepID=UPI000713D0CD|nr:MULTISPECIES: GNAT family N-acetyltransferase [unclassified Rhizobium]KQS87773.1 acetyltransferase [Rhizobium sp. Leaf386]KQS94669.1 acetyltransferase [Rhizobium sp. Leaf391]KQU01683.1 acetyltransferase [Rhizobium sp. Leaf453]
MTTGPGHPVFRQDYFGDPAAWSALVALLHDTFDIDVGIQDRFGGPDPTSMPFGYFDADGTCIANFSAFSMSVIIEGRPVKAAGFQSGAVRPQWRGRGLYRDLMNRAFSRCDAQGFELGLLLTDKPALYEPYGFRVVPQHKFVGSPPPIQPWTSARRLSLENADDIDLLKNLLFLNRVPVSERFAVASQAEMFLLNSFFDGDVRLDYLEAFDAVAAWKEDAGTVQLLDIAGRAIPLLGDILAALGVTHEDVEVCFPPDKLGWQGMPEVHASGTSLMIRGLPAESLVDPVMLSPMAEF